MIAKPICVIVGMLTLVALPAHSATCTLSGTIKIEPMDQYYCDPDVSGLSCSGWKEVDLDDQDIQGAGPAPMKYLFVTIRQGSQTLAHTYTNSSGTYSTTFTLSSCSGQVQVEPYFIRAEPDPGNPTWLLFRFGIKRATVLVADDPTTQAYETQIDESDDFWMQSAWNVSLSGASTTAPERVYLKSASPSSIVRVANVFYTASSAISEMRTWSTSLFTAVQDPQNDPEMYRIVYDPAWDPPGGGGSTAYSKRSTLSYGGYAAGLTTRHELGHAAVGEVFDNLLDWNCYSMSFNQHVGGHPFGCEWGYGATDEGLADFFAVRSITSSSMNAFQCGRYDFSNEDTCSEAAMFNSDPDGQGDHFWEAGGRFAGIGDKWSDGTGTCVQLEKSGGCPCSGTNCTAADDQNHGWRNPVQVSRFFWDMIDSNDDSAGSDDTDIGMDDFVAVLLGMPCAGSSPGQDGSCQEPAKPPGQCIPASETAGLPDGGLAYGTGSRDSFNVWDIAEAIPGSQSDERVSNCVDEALD